MTLNETVTNNGFQSIHIHSNDHYKTFTENGSSSFDMIDLKCKNFENVYIIDSYRTPIERKISSFFENLRDHLPNYNELSIQELITYFNDNKLYELEEYHSINEVLEYYNIPLFNVFDFKKQYNRIKQDNKIFIKILFADINNWDKILSDIFKTQIVIYSANLSIDKEYFKLYNQFKENYKVPIKYINNLLINDSEFKIYNTIDQQNDYIQQWLLKSY